MNDLIVQLAIIILIIIALAYFMLKPQIKELLGKEEKKEKCPRCGKKTSVFVFSNTERGKLVCGECGEREESERE